MNRRISSTESSHRFLYTPKKKRRLRYSILRKGLSIIFLSTFGAYCHFLITIFNGLPMTNRLPGLYNHLFSPEEINGTDDPLKIFNHNDLNNSIAISPLSSSQLQKVYVLPELPPSKATGEYAHFIIDGIDQSYLLERTMDPYDPHSVWVVDLVKIACGRDVVPLVQDRWEHMLNESLTDEKPKPWKIFFIDLADDWYRGAVKCARPINKIFNSEEKYLHLTTRHVMQERRIAHEKREPDNTLFSTYGKNRTFDRYRRQFNGTVRILRYGVRTDLVNCINEIIEELKPNQKDDKLSIVHLPRNKDVVHFWNANSSQVGTARHRTYVSKSLDNFAKESKNANRTIFSGLLGEARRYGRRRAQRPYAEALLEYKIVIVCQRDKWEDHYRLMEGLTGGALVLTDPMHPLPLHIEHKKQVIVYRSIRELKDYITYYLNHEDERLKIASAGHEVAMKEHRSGKWMERIIFGNWNSSDGT